ncbi:MAG TPA: DNA mismatch repair endonuclease MutL [Kofleriaceae bacterium]|nr:DNA mismatch repair endonuclease MutL [Kofleriaceae bacterium]
MIAVLAPHVIDQIAAGEVIERPASVVKELVDNAIDAGATAIAIEVAGGGRSLVRVSDDGCGMSAKAAVLALERHATSKLREVDDLWGIASMGFRGEALPSIASVSRMTLTTRRAGDDAGTRITVEAGRLLSVTDAGAPVGTTVEVTDLLYNLPARLKFLKGEATEASHVTELVAKIAMAYPRLHLRLKHNGRTALDVPPDRDGLARAQALLGPRIAARLVPVMGEESGVRVTAYLAAPELAQATARGVQLFVGRRPVRDRGLLHAVTMGYGELIPRGRYPIAVVLIDVPAGGVDVNVHPQKLEVRFSDASAVAAAVRHVVQAGVGAARWRDEGAGAVPVQVLASVAPPSLPFDGQVATQLSERHVAQMRSRQVPLGFGAADASIARPGGRLAARPVARDVARPAGGPGAPAWPSGRSAEPRSGPLGPSPGAMPGAMPGAPAGPAGYRTSAAASPRDWARELREQARASRLEEPRGPVRAGGSDPPHDDGSRPGSERDGAGQWPVCDDDTQPPGKEHLSIRRPGSSTLSLTSTLSPNVDVDGDGDVDSPVDLARGPSGEGRALSSRTPPEGRGQTSTMESTSTSPSRTTSRVDVHVEVDAIRPADGSGPVAVSGFFSQLRYLGQLDLTYLVCEGDGELVMIDQHAAHERVELARLRARHAAGDGEPRIAVQKMLFPVTLEATPQQLALVARVGPLLSQVGFEVEPFGKSTLAVKAVPAGIRHGDPAQLLRALLHDWAEAGAPSEAERLDRLLGEIACHSVVRAGDRLAPSEVETLLRSLDGVDLSLPAPHGRAVLLRLPLTEIGRRFGR